MPSAEPPDAGASPRVPGGVTSAPGNAVASVPGNGVASVPGNGVASVPGNAGASVPDDAGASVPDDAAIAALLLDLARRRGPGASFCPSEVARALAADWRPLMPAVRRVAAALAAAGRLAATRRGRPVDPASARGPIRLRHP